MSFDTFRDHLKNHIDSFLHGTLVLFELDSDQDKLWSIYLESFPDGTNPLFRKKNEHDCSNCRHFIKHFGNVAMIKNNVLTTIWDFSLPDSDDLRSTYQPVMDAMARYLHTCKVKDVFLTKENTIGIKQNKELVGEGNNTKLRVWNHLYTNIPKSLVYTGSDTLDSKKGEYRDVRNVFKRSLDELSINSVDTVLELIVQNSLYKGEEWKSQLQQFSKLLSKYNSLSEESKELFAWEQSVAVGPVIGKIRNHSIGTLLQDITNNVDLDMAVRKYEALVAPSNYKRPKALFTQKMLEDAKKEIENLGYLNSLARRYARLEDITVNNILYANRDASKRISGSVFDEMSKGIAVDPRSFNRAEEISIGDFIKNVVPTAKNIEALVENRHVGNLVSLIAPKDSSSPSMLKWTNGFSWAYSGNMTDSMKERVKAAGGKIDGVLRFSIQWNEDGDNRNDFDAHAIEPTGHEIYFRNRYQSIPSTGRLDVDIICPNKDQVAVENITWTDRNRMPEGIYTFFVHNFNHRGGRSGFRAEIEFDGQIYSFACNRNINQSERVEVAEVHYSRKDGFKLIEKLPSSSSSRKVWGVNTNQLHPVTVMMYSPNYWDDNEGIGNRHVFFMLKDCVNEESPNGFFNEFLDEKLMKHKHILEAMGGKMCVEHVDDQMSGIGFCTTKPNSLIVKVEGNVSRLLKINF